jgi:hypothetical protein
MKTRKKRTYTAAQKARQSERSRAWYAKMTPEERLAKNARERARRKQEVEEARIRFTCPRCGGEFTVPQGDFSQKPDERYFVRLGGQTVCEVCAASRFKRRRVLWGINPDSIF